MSPRRTLPIRAAATLMALTAVIVVTALAAVAFRLLGTSRAELHELETSTAAYGELSRRAAQLSDWVTRIATVVARGAPATDLTAVRERLHRSRGRLSPLAVADLPAAVREPIAAADLTAARLERQLAVVIARVELGRWAGARAGLASAARLEDSVQARAEAVQRQGLQALLVRQAAFQTTVGRVVLLFLVAGALLLGSTLAILLFLRHRVLRPLGRLNEALSRVEAGDLTAAVTPRHDDEVGRLLAHFNRVTRVLRDRAEQQGRLAAAGELVASIAHEVNNPLQAIGLTAETALDTPNLPAQVREDLEQIVRQAERAGVLVRGFLRFAKPRETDELPTDTNAVVHEAVELLRYQFGVEQIEVCYDLAADVPPVACAVSGLEQIVVNLIANAIYALRDAPAPRHMTVTSRREGDEVVIRVEDSGGGVPQDQVDQLFRPFHTTKGERGTGLGLYISRQIARGAGGDLTLERSAGGARFAVRLPASREAAAPAPAPETHGTTVPHARHLLRGISVMVAEDDAAVRQPLARYLRATGATVIEAANGREAVARLAQALPDVIVLDLRMPEMSGTEVVRWLRREHPAAAERVLVVSGDPRELAEVHMPRDRVLVKPIQLDRLAVRIAHAATAVSPPSSA